MAANILHILGPKSNGAFPPQVRTGHSSIGESPQEEAPILSKKEKGIKKILSSVQGTLQETKRTIADIKKNFSPNENEPPATTDVAATKADAFGFVSARISSFLLSEPKNDFLKTLPDRFESFEAQIKTALQNKKLLGLCEKIRVALAKIRKILFYKNGMSKTEEAGRLFANICAYINAFLFSPAKEDLFEMLKVRMAGFPAKTEDSSGDTIQPQIDKLKKLFELLEQG